MKKLIFIDIQSLEREYIDNNTSYIVEQKLLTGSSKEEIQNYIKMIQFSYNNIKMRNKFKVNIIKKSKQYIFWNELKRYFLEQDNYIFNHWWELEEKKQILNKLNNFYKLNHTDFLKKNDYKQIDINLINIRDVISIYTRLPNNLRRNIKCIFPHHKDRTASLRVYENTNSWNCFGCNKWGNAVNFISEMEWIETKEAFKRLVNLITT